MQRAGEDSVMIPLIYVLDSYDPKKSDKLAQVRFNGLNIKISPLEYIRTAADYIRRRFDSYPSIENKFFLFPAKTDLVSSEFGTINAIVPKHNESGKYDQFCEWYTHFTIECMHALLLFI